MAATTLLPPEWACTAQEWLRLQREVIHFAGESAALLRELARHPRERPRLVRGLT